MKGVIFNIFEDFVTQQFGMESWDLVLTESELQDEVFVGPKTYQDSIFLKLLTTAVKLKNLNLDAAVKLFGKFAFAKLALKLPGIIDDYQSPEEVLKALDGIIHVEVKKLMEDSVPPRFVVKEQGDQLVMEYYSARKMCALVEGLVDGLAESYSKKVDCIQTQCVHQNNTHCEFKIKFN